MREIDVGRGTENGTAKFAAVFGLLTKNHRGGPFGPPPPIRARVNIGSRAVLVRNVSRVRKGAGEERRRPSLKLL